MLEMEHQDTEGNTCTQTIPDEMIHKLQILKDMVKMKITPIIKDVKTEKEITVYSQQIKI